MPMAIFLSRGIRAMMVTICNYKTKLCCIPLANKKVCMEILKENITYLETNDALAYLNVLHKQRREESQRKIQIKRYLYQPGSRTRARVWLTLAHIIKISQKNKRLESWRIRTRAAEYMYRPFKVGPKVYNAPDFGIDLSSPSIYPCIIFIPFTIVFL